MEVDIRNFESSDVQIIRFGDGEWLSADGEHSLLFIEGDTSIVEINSSDIDHLIKALEYAKGVWFS